MTEDEQKLFEKAALCTYQAHITEGTLTSKQTARAAWRDAHLFLEAKRKTK